MKKKSSTKKSLVSKADLDKINNAVDRADAKNGMHQTAFREKLCTLASQIGDMATEEVNADEETARRIHSRRITKTLNELYKLFVKHEDSINVMLRETDEGSAVIALLKFADKVRMFRLLHVPKFDYKSSAKIISFKVYITRLQICWCRIRTTKLKSGIVVLTRFTN